MVFEDFKCDTCGEIIKDVSADSGDKLPKYKKCPNEECDGKCYRVWNNAFSIIIPEHFKATSSTKGNNWTKDKMKTFKGQNKKKRFY